MCIYIDGLDCPVMPGPANDSALSPNRRIVSHDQCKNATQCFQYPIIDGNCNFGTRVVREHNPAVKPP